MKSNRIVLLALIGVVVALAAMLSQTLAQNKEAAPAAGPAKIGVADIVFVFNNYEKAKDLTVKFDKRRQELQVENEKRKKEIDDKQMELEHGLKPGSAEYEQRLSDVQRLSIERESWMKFQDNLALREHHRLTQQMYKEIIDSISKIAKEQGINVVLFRERGDVQSDNTQDLLRQIERRKVLYCDDNMDMTDTVLLRVNEAYKAAGAKP